MSSHNMDDDVTKEFDQWDPMAEDYNSILNTLSLDPKDSFSLITGKAQPVDHKIGGTTLCEHFAKYGTCVDGQYCSRKHIDPSQRERLWTIQNLYDSCRDRTCLNYTILSPQNIKPDPNKLLLVSVTNAESPNNFYLIAPYEKDFSNLNDSDIKFFIDNVPKNSTAKIKLQMIHEQLSQLFDKPFRIDNLNETIYLSQIMACKLGEGSFRRAMVTGLPDDFNEEFYYTLLLLDVGTQIQLPRELIYDIRASCLSEPPMALNCRLNLKPANGELTWSDLALQTFEEKSRRDQYLLCKVINFIECDRIYTVELLHLKSRKSLTEVLLKTGQVELLD